MSLPYSRLKKSIKAEALRLGFSLSGFTLPEPPKHYSTFLDWISRGDHAGMDYLAGEYSLGTRSKPQILFPETRSILSLAMPYPTPEPLQSDDPLRGKMASYAWSIDYHHVIPTRLQALAFYIQELSGAALPGKGFCDTGAILERDFATSAGLGWIGKNTNLIHPHLGSHFFLAELFLPIPIEPDPPFEADRCGTCRRCLEACPTGCILPNRTIDAKRCIAYLTIENRAEIPLELRPQIGNRIFGCDVCQQVCPWNKAAHTSKVETCFAQDGEHLSPLLSEELLLTAQGFNAKYRTSPLKRAKRGGYLRNVAVAAGNARDPQIVPYLIKAFEQEPEALVRGHLAWAIRQYPSAATTRFLENQLATEIDPFVAHEIRASLDRHSP